MRFTPLSTGDPLLLTFDHASWHLGVPAPKVRQLVQAGELPAVRIGGRVLIRRADLEAWVARLVPDATHRAVKATDPTGVGA